MSTEPQLFRVDPNTKVSVKASKVDFSSLGLEERTDIQEWVVANPEILGDDLLIIAKEFSDFDLTKERLDLLAIDRDGKLVIIELKRDDSGKDVHGQAIKYASYLRDAKPEKIIRIFADYERFSEAEAKILEHIETDSLDNLNGDQRIILASHRFAREVTSAVLWLNDKAQNKNLITCVQLIPHQDDDEIFLQTKTIIPDPGAPRYSIQVGRNENGARSSGTRTPRRSNRSGSNQSDSITKFSQDVEARTNAKLPEKLRTNSNYGYARGNSNERWYSIWYEGRYPWASTRFSYIIHVIPRKNGLFSVVNNLEIRKKYLRNKMGYSDGAISELKALLSDCIDCDIQDNGTYLRPRRTVAEYVSTLDEALIEHTAQSMATMIKAFTEKVEAFVANQSGS